LPASIERHETHSMIRLEGEFAVTSAAELKRTLLQGLAAGKDLQLDLERAQEVDITVLQLLLAAAREAERAGVGITMRWSDAARQAAWEAGFERLPELAVQV
jgi:anti-anti-sigma regulatory factor